MPLQPLTTRDHCLSADARDSLASFRGRFNLPDDVIYLDGNSLGVLPSHAPGRAHEIIHQEWGKDLIGSWNKHHWFDLPVRIGAKIAQLIGGARGAAVATDTTSLNIYKALGAALDIQRQKAPGRRIIVSERESFPTDLYMIEGLIRTLNDGYELRLIDDKTTLGDALGADVAVVLLTQVNYRTGQLWDMSAATETIHDAGALVIWDLCHSVGALPIGLDEADVDFAVGCTYKYLNGGPGAPAFIWVADRHVNSARQPLAGWWGHERPFEMALNYTPSSGIRRYLTGTQPLISLATMECGLDIALEVDDQALRSKSIELSSLFIDLVEQRIPNQSLTLITPRDPDKRGSHVSFRHPEGYAVMQSLIARGVIGDYREPEVLRFAITPLYTRYVDIWDSVEVLRYVLAEGLWCDPEFAARGAVT